MFGTGTILYAGLIISGLLNEMSDCTSRSHASQDDSGSCRKKARKMQAGKHRPKGCNTRRKKERKQRRSESLLAGWSPERLLLFSNSGRSQTCLRERFLTFQTAQLFQSSSYFASGFLLNTRTLLHCCSASIVRASSLHLTDLSLPFANSRYERKAACT